MCIRDSNRTKEGRGWHMNCSHFFSLLCEWLIEVLTCDILTVWPADNDQRDLNHYLAPALLVNYCRYHSYSSPDLFFYSSFYSIPVSTFFYSISIPVIFTARRYASAVLAVIVCLSVRLSVCPSVCPSVTSRSCTKMAKPRIRLTTPYDSPETLVFRCQKSWRNSNDITPNGGAK